MDPSDNDDPDVVTNAMIFRDNMTWSRGRIRRHKLLSMIQGNPQPSRKKIFSEVKIDEDRKIYAMEVQGKRILCAKIYNPAVFFMKKGNTTWSELAEVNRLEIEDHEGILSTVPKQLLTELQKLESLTINWTKIRSLPESLFQLPLISLYLQRNHIRSLSGIHLAAQQLTILDVSNNCIVSLPKTFGQLVNLITLNASGNAIRELPSSIGSLVHLRTLNVSSNKLRSLPTSIGTLIDLISLDVSNNQLVELPDSLTGLPSLEDLQVRSNCLSSLPASMHRLTRLNSLLLRGNRFAEVPAVLGRLVSLINLNMRDNSIRRMTQPIASLRCLVLDHNEMTEIDKGVLGCLNLQLLSMNHNRLVEIPPGIVCLTALRSLLLSDNGIVQVPPEVARLDQLRHLGLRATKIVTVPIDVAQLPRLANLELDECDELDSYLKLAYKETGLPGVIEYLISAGGSLAESSESSQITSKSIVDMTNRCTMAPEVTSLPLSHIDNRKTMMPDVDTDLVPVTISKRVVVLNGSASRQTIMPVNIPNDVQVATRSHKDGGLTKEKLQAAGLLIDNHSELVTWNTNSPTSGSTIKQVTRQTLYPIEMVNIGDQGNKHGVHDVRQVNPIFGDLMSSSTGVITDSQLDAGSNLSDVTWTTTTTTTSKLTTFGKKPPPQVASKPTAKVNLGLSCSPVAEVGEQDDDDGDDWAELYAKVTKKSAVRQPLSRGNQSKTDDTSTSSKKVGVRFADD